MAAWTCSDPSGDGDGDGDGIRTANGLTAYEAISHDTAEVRSREEEWQNDGGAASAA